MEGRVVVQTDFQQGLGIQATKSRYGAKDMLKEKEVSGRGTAEWLGGGSSA